MSRPPSHIPVGRDARLSLGLRVYTGDARRRARASGSVPTFMLRRDPLVRYAVPRANRSRAAGTAPDLPRTLRIGNINPLRSIDNGTSAFNMHQVQLFKLQASTTGGAAPPSTGNTPGCRSIPRLHGTRCSLRSPNQVLCFMENPQRSSTKPLIRVVRA